MSGAVGGAGTVPAAPANDAAQPNQQAWNTATGAAGGNAEAAAQKQMEAGMIGQIGMMTLMPLIMQAMNAGQDDS